MTTTTPTLTRAEQRLRLSELLARLVIDGWTAESPETLDPEARRIARADRADYTD